MEVPDADNKIAYEWIDDGDGKIGIYGAINIGKEGDSLGQGLGEGSSVRFSMYVDTKKYAHDSTNIYIYCLLMFGILQVFAIVALFMIRRNNRVIKKSDKARDLLISSMAQEMKTPSEIITSCAEMINESGDSENTEKYETIISEEAEHISDLVSHMLNYTRKAGTGYYLNLEKVDMGSLADKVCERHKLITDKRDITVEIIKKNQFILDADKKMMEMVVDNYISNVIALCDDG
ncbi:MAG: HAMP domain-containing histidine kinase, partial [Lachnospiraceae bacterium]|nr:HAMP domain-containing histidine kinase [Lachnospiraceae bacterium]